MDPVKIQTPEYVEFSYQLAGLGSRFVAYSLDFLLQTGVAFLIFLIFGVTAAILEYMSGTGWLQDALNNSMLAVVILALFLIYWGYFIYFESLWNGQTPGKRVVGIRVIREGGYPVTLVSILLRNLLRVVDWLPLLYGIGIIGVFVSSQHKRIGDLAAGTVVVREREKTRLEPPVIPEEAPETLPFNVRLTSGQYGIINQFLSRRNEIVLENRERIARTLALPLLEAAGEKLSDSDYEGFLEKVAAQYRHELGGG